MWQRGGAIGCSDPLRSVLRILEHQAVRWTREVGRVELIVTCASLTWASVEFQSDAACKSANALHGFTNSIARTNGHIPFDELSP